MKTNTYPFCEHSSVCFQLNEEVLELECSSSESNLFFTHTKSNLSHFNE